jgi:hypothetical protein
VAEPLEDRHDHEYLAMRGCAVLAEVGYTFRIGGFGQDDWGFDVPYDLSTLVEQLPELLGGLATHGLGELDFYSQGVERSVTFERSAEAYVLRCRSRTSFTPSPDVEHVGVARLGELFTRLTTEFSAGLRAAFRDRGSAPVRQVASAALEALLSGRPCGRRRTARAPQEGVGGRGPIPRGR